jgi:hypothetical protein
VSSARRPRRRLHAQHFAWHFPPRHKAIVSCYL